MTGTSLSGYDLFIWPSYALAALFIFGCILHSLMQARRVKQKKSSDESS